MPARQLSAPAGDESLRACILLWGLMLAGLPFNSLPSVDLPLKRMFLNEMSIFRTEGDTVVGQVGQMLL